MSFGDTETPKPPADAGQWLSEHGSFLFRFAYLRVRDTHLAEDFVQETLIIGLQKYESFRGESTVRTWLFAVLRSVMSKHFRKRNKVRQQSIDNPAADLATLLDPQIDADLFRSNLEKEEFWKAIQNCFDRVPEHLLETFLHRIANSDKSIDEICVELKITPSNYSVRLFRTRLMLRKCLETTWMAD